MISHLQAGEHPPDPTRRAQLPPVCAAERQSPLHPRGAPSGAPRVGRAPSDGGNSSWQLSVTACPSGTSPEWLQVKRVSPPCLIVRTTSLKSTSCAPAITCQVSVRTARLLGCGRRGRGDDVESRPAFLDRAPRNGLASQGIERHLVLSLREVLVTARSARERTPRRYSDCPTAVSAASRLTKLLKL